VIQRCLKRFGIDVPLGSPEKAANAQHRADWYGLTNEDTAREYGYSGARPVVPEQDQPFIRRIPRPAQPLVTGDAPGSPDGGCQGESNRVITEGSPAVQDDYLVRKLEKQAVDQARRDNEVVARVEDWQACLKQDFADPMAPYAHWNAKRPKGTLTVSPEESAMAVADVRCKRETGLLDTWAGATIVYQRKLADQNAGQLRLHRQRLERNVQNAERVSAQP
jgi:hypothetical protein